MACVSLVTVTRKTVTTNVSRATLITMTVTANVSQVTPATITVTANVSRLTLTTMTVTASVSRVTPPSREADPMTAMTPGSIQCQYLSGMSEPELAR